MDRARAFYERERALLGVGEWDVFSDFIGAKFPTALAAQLRYQATVEGMPVSALVRKICSIYCNSLDLAPPPVVELRRTSDKIRYV